MSARSERIVALRELELPLLLALKRMLAADETTRPFVIVEDTATDRFVQFATECPASGGLPLVFDVPALGITEGCKGPPEATLRALDVLVKGYGLDEGAMLRIIEDATWQRPRGLFERVKGLLRPAGAR